MKNRRLATSWEAAQLRRRLITILKGGLRTEQAEALQMMTTHYTSTVKAAKDRPCISNKQVTGYATMLDQLQWPHYTNGNELPNSRYYRNRTIRLEGLRNIMEISVRVVRGVTRMRQFSA
jgi:hypothetical protein